MQPNAESYIEALALVSKLWLILVQLIWIKLYVDFFLMDAILNAMLIQKFYLAM